MKKKPKTILLFAILFNLNALAENKPTSKHKSKYIGQENRLIKSLSAHDLESIKKGKGWGLAKAAELNGVPGPLHLLEMKKEIALSSNQIKKIEKLYEEMKTQAIAEGKTLISLERELNLLFSDNSVTNKKLKNILERVSKSYSDLRYIHLSAHIKASKFITSEQTKNYNKLRGYGENPCKSIPIGHDPVMWKKHHDCS